MTRKNICLGLWALFIVLCPALTIGFYVFKFHALDISSSNPIHWAQFGTYFNGILNPIFSLINLFVVVYIAIHIKELQETRLSSKRLTLDLYNEWHEEKLHQSRIEVDGLIAQNKATKTPLPTLSAMERDVNGKCTAKHAFRIYHFFEKWAVLARAREIDNKLLLRLLGSYVEWWRNEFFAEMSKSETDKYMTFTLDLIFTYVFNEKPISEKEDAPHEARP